MHRQRLRVAVAALGAVALAAAVGATSAAAAPAEATPAYQFASNYGNGAHWRVSNSPVVEPDAYQSTAGGGVRLYTRPATGQYADSGVVVPLGTVGEWFGSDGYLKDIPMDGPDLDALAVNLYVDADGDGHYLSFAYNGVYQNNGGDQVLLSVTAGVTKRTDIPSDDDTPMWAWVGVSGDTAQQANVVSVAGVNLFTPSVLTVTNMCRVVSGQSQNLWLVRANEARDRTFHLGVEYQGVTRWTGLHTVRAGQALGVVTPNGGRAILLYYVGNGTPGYVAPYPTATSDHTRFCG